MCPKEFGELVKSQAYVAESLDKEMTLEVGVPTIKSPTHWHLAQLVERLSDTEEVVGSTPTVPTDPGLRMG